MTDTPFDSTVQSIQDLAAFMREYLDEYKRAGANLIHFEPIVSAVTERITNPAEACNMSLIALGYLIATGYELSILTNTAQVIGLWLGELPEDWRDRL